MVALQKFIGFPFKQGDPKGCNMERADLFWTLKQFYGGQTLPGGLARELARESVMMAMIKSVTKAVLKG